MSDDKINLNPLSVVEKLLNTIGKEKTLTILTKTVDCSSDDNLKKIYSSLIEKIANDKNVE